MKLLDSYVSYAIFAEDDAGPWWVVEHLEGPTLFGLACYRSDILDQDPETGRYWITSPVDRHFRLLATITRDEVYLAWYYQQLVLGHLPFDPVALEVMSVL